MYSRDTEDRYDDTSEDQNQNKNKIPYQLMHRSSAILNNQSLNDYEQSEELYVFVKFLGRGAFGSVNLYRHTKENILVAWKEIDLRGTELSQNEISSEIDILASLDHPNIIGYYKHFEGDNCIYLELEYANGGTLMHMIQQQRTTGQNFSEETVIWYFYQIMSAVDYLHDQQILHRDIKSLNIFSTKSGLLKLGDFGLAKRVDTGGFANTQVGTPHYMAPEILNGDAYNAKSDIWSVGCVIYEVLTLSKVFDATNQLKLVMRILLNDVNEIDEDYSEDLKDLVKQMLEKNSCLRPTAKEILSNKLISSKIAEYDDKITNLNYFNRKSRASSTTGAVNQHSLDSVPSLTENLVEFPIIASKLSESYIWGGGKQIPQKLETFVRENAPLQVCVGFSHYAVITVLKELYTWAASQCSSRSNNHAKLGLGKSFGSSRSPKLVDSLSGIFVKQVACGEDFTCCLADDGTLYTFGTDYCGCLGIEQEEFEILNEDEEISDGFGNIYKPVPVPFFNRNSIKIAKVACGNSHVVCLTTDNEIYTWGNGELGRLGHGDENDIDVPRRVNFRLKYKFKNVFAGPDCTILVTDKGKVLAFGNNEYNKLGLNDTAVGVKKRDKADVKMSNDILCQLKPKLVKNLSKYRIFKVAVGSTHTSAIDTSGRLITFGCNKHGQLGVGDCKVRHGINVVGGALREHHVINVACGDSFTICATKENHVFSWGSCKDGRLGIDLAFNRDDVICLPRPIFGSLYLVSDMCSRHWNSIIIAEKIIDAKAVRSVSYKSTLVSSIIASSQNDSADSDYETYNERNDNISFNLNNLNDERLKPKPSIFDNIPQCSKAGHDIVSDNMPDWLKHDLEDAEFIPVEALKQPGILNKPTGIIIKDNSLEIPRQSSIRTSEPDITTLEEALELIKKLKEENSGLKEQNLKLIAEIEELKKET